MIKTITLQPGEVWSPNRETAQQIANQGDAPRTIVVPFDEPGEVLGTAQPTEATKYDSGKPNMALFPPEAMLEISRVWSFGEKKYAAHNWRKGFAYSRPAAAALRHIFAWLGGQDKDEESGLSHLAHAACCLCMLIAFQQNRIGKDDRCNK